MLTGADDVPTTLRRLTMLVLTRSLRRSTAALAAEQARLAACLEGVHGHHLARVLTRLGHDRLAGHRHFGARAEELGWSGPEVLAHLRDGALATFEQVRRLRREDHPLLPSPPAGPPLTTASLRSAPDRLVRQVIAAHQLLADELHDLLPAEQDRRGELPGRGAVTVAEVVRLHTDHLRSHVDQLRELFA